MSEQGKRQFLQANQLIEHLRQIIQVPENVTGVTIECEAGDCARIEWRTFATPARDAKQ